MIGAYSIVFGVLLIALGVRLKKVRGHAQRNTSHLVCTVCFPICVSF